MDKNNSDASATPTQSQSPQLSSPDPSKDSKHSNEFKDDKDEDEKTISSPKKQHDQDEAVDVDTTSSPAAPPPPSLTQLLFRFSTTPETVLDLVGLLMAIVAGAAQPLQTIIFGSVTGGVVDFGSQLIGGGGGEGDTGGVDPEVLHDAIKHIEHTVEQGCLKLVYIGLAGFIATYFYMGIWVWSGEKKARRLRESYLKAVLGMEIAYFDQLGAGEVATRIQTDTQLVQNGISEKVPFSLMFISTFFSGFIVGFIKNWRLALVLSSMLPGITVTGGLIGHFASKFNRDKLDHLSGGGNIAEESISSIRTAQAFSIQPILVDLYDGFNKKVFVTGKKAGFLQALTMGIMFFVIYASYALAFWWGTQLILRGDSNAGEIITVFFAVTIGSFALSIIAPNVQALSLASGAAAKLYETIDRVPTIQSDSDEGLTIEREKLTGTITFEDVEFVYPSRPTIKVLKDYSATFPRGKVTALVGASGCGKSSTVALMERFYDPTGGKIMFDGHDLKDLNVKWLRRQIGLVSQEPTLFSETIFVNVAHGLIGTKYEQAPRSEVEPLIIEACKKSNAHDFVTSLTQGYDSVVGEGGILLSGGQKQRIAIARAIVKDPPILLLDEATSALDTASEGIVQEALEKASEGRTTIAIAHRLSTIKSAAQIIVMAHGEILETGRHDELLNIPDGNYARLVRAQELKEKEEARQEDENMDELVPDVEIGEEIGHVGETDRKEEIIELEEGLGRKLTQNSLPASLKRRTTALSIVSSLKGGETKGKGRENPYSPGRVFMRMARMNRRSAGLYLFGAIGAGLSGIVMPVFGILMGTILDSFSSPDRAKLKHDGYRTSLYLFIISIAAGVAMGAQNFGFGLASERLCEMLRVQNLAAILKQDISYFDREENSTGALTSSVAENAQKVSGLAGVTLGTLINSVVTLIGGCVVALCFGWKLALVGIACLPLLLAMGAMTLMVIVSRDKDSESVHFDSSQKACEAAGAIRTVAALTKEEQSLEEYARALDTPQKSAKYTALVSNLFFSASQAMSLWVSALVFWWGMRLVINDGYTTQNLFVTMMAVVFGAAQAGQSFSLSPDVSRAYSGAVAIFKLFDARPRLNSDSGKRVPDCRGHIEFRDVSFRYPTRKHIPVLKGVNIDVKPGEFIALVGSSGSGKSTVVSLIERFYDPIRGTILLDGQPISELNHLEYRKNIALVSQEPTLYRGSIRFNITLGATIPAEEVRLEDIEKACHDANIWDFVKSLPDGLDTEVGGKGAQLSGGQKQRIAIARALIRNPKVLLLDEATSALDSESEKVVQAALDKAAKGRATVAIAHRLSTIQHANKIYVIREGAVAEEGHHQELLAKKSIYYELVHQQGLGKQNT